MIVLPDGKVCRNLPEQVAENLKKIQEIIHFLDGVNIQDNLVGVADLSQILTAAELEIVERPVAFIYYNDELYIKKNEDSGNAYFDNIFSISPSASQVDFASNEIEVVLSTGALSMTSATASVYPTSQVDTLLAAKADLTGATFTGDVKAQTLEQSQANYVIDLNFINMTDITVNNVYCKLIIVNNILYGIVCLKLTNTSAATKTLFEFATTTSLSIPAIYGDRIIDIDGNKVSEAIGSRTTILREPTPDAGTSIVLYNGTSANAAQIVFHNPISGWSINAGETKTLFGRFFCLLF